MVKPESLGVNRLLGLHRLVALAVDGEIDDHEQDDAQERVEIEILTEEEQCEERTNSGGGKAREKCRRRHTSADRAGSFAPKRRLCSVTPGSSALRAASDIETLSLDHPQDNRLRCQAELKRHWLTRN
jgi:hypothetical protein